MLDLQNAFLRDMGLLAQNGKQNLRMGPPNATAGPVELRAEVLKVRK